VPACLTDHLRVWTDGRPRGYQLLIEQPDKAFLTRNRWDNTGNLYKLIWQGQGIAGQNEKKTHLEAGKTDLIELIQSLDRLTGAEQWEFIQKHFNVPEWTSYYAVNMCIQNWDGFHNNYFSYHDTGGTGKWEIYPWDEDKTWGDYDGASSKYDWYEMPLTMGMRGDRSPRLNPLSRGNSFPGFYGGVSWWRPGGWFGAPLLANAEFRKRFLDRLEEICGTVFTEAKVNPLIDALEKKLEPEIVVRAQVDGEDPGQAMKRFQNDLQSFRNQVKFRRQFILDELPKAKKALSP
jgi:spore coat protein CotH